MIIGTIMAVFMLVVARHYNMFYAISVPLIMPENMRFCPYSYPCFLRTLNFDGWSI